MKKEFFDKLEKQLSISEKGNDTKNPQKTVVLLHLGGWYKAFGDSAKIISFLMDYKLFEDPRNGRPSIGFPESSIDKVAWVLRKNKINYILRYDDDEIVDYKEENNFDRFLHNDLPYSYVWTRGEVNRQPKGRFVVKYDDEEPEEYIIGEDINPDAELVKKVVGSEVGDIIVINDFKIKIIEKEIEY